MTNLVTMMREYAQDRYYRYSWDVVATQWSDAEIAQAIEGAKTRRGAIAKAWGRLQVIDRNRCRYERPVKPASLLEFLAMNGGLRSDDKLITEVRESVGGNCFMPRFGWLIREPKQLSTAARKGGIRAPMFLDGAREAAVEAGYLQETNWNGGVSTTTVNDLLELIDQEARGRKIYPCGQEPFEPFDDRQEETDDVPF